MGTSPAHQLGEESRGLGRGGGVDVAGSAGLRTVANFFLQIVQVVVPTLRLLVRPYFSINPIANVNQYGREKLVGRARTHLFRFS